MEFNRLENYKVSYRRALMIFFSFLCSLFSMLLLVILLEIIMGLDINHHVYIFVFLLFLLCLLYVFKGNYIFVAEGQIHFYKYHRLSKSISISKVKLLSISLHKSNSRSMYYALSINTENDTVFLNYITYNRRKLLSFLKHIITESKCEVDNNVRSLMSDRGSRSDV